jgi:hypothetical protein
LILLTKVGESWPDALLCSEYLSSIVDEINHAYRDRTLNDIDATQQEKERSTTERLRQLLFPKGQLSWSTPGFSGPQSTEASTDGTTEEIDFAGFEDFDWNIHWDLLQDLSPIYSDSTTG